MGSEIVAGAVATGITEKTTEVALDKLIEHWDEVSDFVFGFSLI
jgi:hypothetical protein